jgi:kynureninase
MPAMTLPTTREEALELDAHDPLAPLRDRFLLPDGVIYLDGNSLGPLPATVPARLDEVVRREWGHDLIRSWNTHGWIDLPQRVGDLIAPLIGAAPGEVVVADSISVNLFKLLAAALRMRPGRRVIVSERSNFPTDVYMAHGLAELLGDVEVRLAERDRLEAAIDDRTAVVMLTHVDFRTGEMHDMAAMTRHVHERGALMLWDLAHSAGAVPVDLGACNVDLAVGCGYKYLNGGPGAPAFAFVARRLHDEIETPLPGWMGHAAPFEMASDYRPAAGVTRLLCGTPPILSLAALEEGVETMIEAGTGALRAKSVALTELFIGLVDETCAGHGLEVASPRDPERRGSQVSLRLEHGYPVMQALIGRDVIGDFRPPDLMRFGFAPAYLRFVDVWDAVTVLREILEDGSWDRPEHHARSKVT